MTRYSRSKGIAYPAPPAEADGDDETQDGDAESSSCGAEERAEADD